MNEGPKEGRSLAQSVILDPDIPLHLAALLPRLKQRFADDMANIEANPSLGRRISEMQDDEARRSLVRQYFLSFQTYQPIDAISTESIIAAFDADAADPSVALDFGPLYLGRPENGAIRLPLPFLVMI